MMLIRSRTIATALLALLAVTACRSPGGEPQSLVAMTLTLRSDVGILGLQGSASTDGTLLELVAVESDHPNVLVIAHADPLANVVHFGLISSQLVAGDVARVHLRTLAPDALHLASLKAVGAGIQPLPPGAIAVVSEGLPGRRVAP